MEEVHKKLIKFIPMGRLGEASEIKGFAAYLALDAASYVTGSMLVHDGGFIT